MNKNKNVWVLIETTNTGECSKVGLELLTPAKMIANELEEDLYAIIIGNEKATENALKELKKCDLKNVYVIKSDIYTEYNPETFEYALSTLALKYEPSTILIGATDIGRDLAPRVASSLDAGLTADCTELSVDKENKAVLWSRPTFSGNLMAVITSQDAKYQIGTVRQGVFKKTELQIPNELNIITENIELEKEKIRTRIIKNIAYDKLEKIDFETAEIIVSGGRGLENAKNFKLVEDLADILNAEVGCTRAVVEAGWKSHAYQIGQSGKTINPKIYIAVGISGAVQHTCGIKGSDIIIAINKDADAPIFNIADYGIVGDLFEIIPILIEKLKTTK